MIWLLGHQGSVTGSSPRFIWTRGLSISRMIAGTCQKTWQGSTITTTSFLRWRRSPRSCQSVSPRTVAQRRRGSVCWLKWSLRSWVTPNTPTPKESASFVRRASEKVPPETSEALPEPNTTLHRTPKPEPETVYPQPTKPEALNLGMFPLLSTGY